MSAQTVVVAFLLTLIIAALVNRLGAYAPWIYIGIMLWGLIGVWTIFPKIPNLKECTTVAQRAKIAFCWPFYLYWLKVRDYEEKKIAEEKKDENR